MYRILHSVPDIDAVPESLRPQVAAALAKDPQDRPTADELLVQLTGTAAPDRGSDSPTQTVLLRTWRPASATRPDSPAGKRAAGRRPCWDWLSWSAPSLPPLVSPWPGSRTRAACPPCAPRKRPPESMRTPRYHG
jgi:hypothetical protein